jgi:hypothetical protein
MVASSWQPKALASSASAPAEPSSWSTLTGRALTCSSAEYQGDAGLTTQAGCLAKAQAGAKDGVNYAVWNTNRHCYLCAIQGEPASWAPRLQPSVGAVCFEGEGIVVPASVSAQQSADGRTIVARLVNRAGAAVPAFIDVSGLGAPIASASAVAMAAADLGAQNCAADCSSAAGCKVAPHALTGVKVASAKRVDLELPAYSYTVVSMAL